MKTGNNSSDGREPRRRTRPRVQRTHARRARDDKVARGEPLDARAHGLNLAHAFVAGHKRERRLATRAATARWAARVARASGSDETEASGRNARTAAMPSTALHRAPPGSRQRAARAAAGRRSAVGGARTTTHLTPKPATAAKSDGVIGAAIMRTRTADGASDLHGERRAAARESLAWHAGGGCAADAGRRLFFRLPD